MERGGFRGWRKWSLGTAAVVSYLTAIIIANTLVTTYGPAALPLTATAIIPFDMTARNMLHELWNGAGITIKMGLLILLGSVASFLSGGASAAVCLASCVSFAAAGLVDATTYQILFSRPMLIKMNASNAAAAIIDSVVFPLVAFGSLGVGIMLVQSIMKFTGGFVWSLVAAPFIRKLTT